MLPQPFDETVETTLLLGEPGNLAKESEPVCVRFRAKSPQFSLPFFTKSLQFGLPFLTKSPQFGLPFLTKSPQFGLPFLTKSPQFGLPFLTIDLKLSPHFFAMGSRFIRYPPGADQNEAGEGDEGGEHGGTYRENGSGLLREPSKWASGNRRVHANVRIGRSILQTAPTVPSPGVSLIER